MTEAIVFGLASAIGWGSSDFFVTRAIRTLGVLQLLLYLEILGVVSIVAILAVQPAIPNNSLDAWALAIVLTLLQTAGVLTLYQAYKVGTLSIAAPVASGYAVVTLVLAIGVTGEQPSALALGGAIATVLGVMLVSVVRGETGSTSLAGIPAALAAALFFGVYAWSVEFIIPSLGVFWPVLINRLVDVVLIGGLLLVRRAQFIQPSRAMWGSIALASLLSLVALVSFNIGVSTADTAIVTPLSSLASAVTVLMAWAILRDRLSALQWSGVAIIIMGVVLVGV
ncbi:MAG: DMT family transporter [Chloroflexaceae bacterium]|nr:DMT family transporter [Chloroflexaceae bacterium]